MTSSSLERHRETDDVIYLYTRNKHVTDNDRQEAMSLSLETGKMVYVLSKPRGLRRLFARLMGWG